MNPKQQMEMEKKWRDFRLQEEDEKDAFDAPIPGQIKRHMSKFTDALKKGNLNRGAETWWSSGDTAGGFINKESWGFKVSNDSFAFVNADLNVNGAHYIYLAMA